VDELKSSGYVSFKGIEKNPEDSVSSLLDTLIQNVSDHTRNPFTRGKHIRALKDHLKSSCKNVPQETLPKLLSVINSCFFPGQIDDVLTQVLGPDCLLMALKFQKEVNIELYPRITEITKKYSTLFSEESQNTFAYAFIDIVKHDVKNFARCIPVWGTVVGAYKSHDVLGTPIRYLQSLIQQYEAEKKWHNPLQWYRNNQLKKMLDNAMNYVMDRLGDLEPKVPDNNQINFFLAMLSDFSPEKIAEYFRRNSLMGVVDTTDRFFIFVKSRCVGFPQINQAIQIIEPNQAALRAGSAIKVAQVASRKPKSTDAERYYPDEEDVREYAPHYVPPVFVPARKTENFTNIKEWLGNNGDASQFQPSWIVDIFKSSDGEGEFYLKAMIASLHWSLVFSAACDSTVKLKAPERKYIFELIFIGCREINDLPITSEFIKNFSRIVKSMSPEIMRDSFLPAITAQKPDRLVGLIKDYAERSNDKYLKELVDKMNVAMQSGHQARK